MSKLQPPSRQSSKWLAEISYSLRDTPLLEGAAPQPELLPGPDLDTFTMAKAYFDLKEYDRAAFFARTLTSALGRFLHLYSRYMSAEKKRLDDLTDTVVSPDSAQLAALRQLRAELAALQAGGELDAYGLYVYGVVLRRLGLAELAAPVLVAAIGLEPGHWGAWLELSCLVTSRDKLAALQLPDHWCRCCSSLTSHLASPRHIFLAHTYLELQQNEQAVEIYIGLNKAGLSQSTYLMAQVGGLALVHPAPCTSTLHLHIHLHLHLQLPHSPTSDAAPARWRSPSTTCGRSTRQSHTSSSSAR